MKFLGITLILSIFVLLVVVMERVILPPHLVLHKCTWIVQYYTNASGIDPEYGYGTYIVKCPHGYVHDYMAPANSLKKDSAIQLELDIDIK